MSNNPKLSTLHNQVLTANAAYAAGFGNKGSLALPPARHAAFLVCMDARLDVAKLAGLSEGDAHVIRNAGGRADDGAIRSLVISHKLLGTNEWFVIHHTDCGMEYFNGELMGTLLETSLATAAHDGKAFANVTNEGGAPDGKFINWLTINHGQPKAVADDVHRIARHPLVAKGIPVHGYVYDVKTGKLNHIVSATTKA
jgi:carbonic anhydrase